MLKLSIYCLFICIVTSCSGGGGGGSSSSDTPITVTGSIISLTTSNRTSCAVRGGYVKCWGDNLYGQLGNGTTTSSKEAVLVSNISNINKVDTNGFTTCASSTSGTLYCWGFFNYSTYQKTPIAISGLTNVTDFEVGKSGYICAINSSLLYCFGTSTTNLPIGSLAANSFTQTPVLISGLTNVDRLAIGYDTACVRANNRLYCWGSNGYGIYGNGTTSGSSSTPVDLSSYWTVSQLSINMDHMCLLNNSNKIYCTGYNNAGQVYSAPSTSLISPVSSPTQPYLLTYSGILKVAVGDHHSCAVTGSSTILCWGDNYYYQIGDNTTSVSTHQPSTVYNITNNVVAIAAGDNTTCASFDDETAYCWGDNGNGQLGNGNTTKQNIPARVQGL